MPDQVRAQAGCICEVDRRALAVPPGCPNVSGASAMEQRVVDGRFVVWPWWSQTGLIFSRCAKPATQACVENVPGCVLSERAVAPRNTSR